MPSRDMDAMLGFGGRWWWFPGAQIGTDSEFEWRRDRVFLLEPDGGTIEGIALVWQNSNNGKALRLHRRGRPCAGENQCALP